MKQSVLITLLMITMFFVCACSRQDTTTTPSKDTAQNTSAATETDGGQSEEEHFEPVEEQIDLVLEQKEVWLQDIPTGPEKWDKYYAITDLNLDGSLELIATTGEIGSSGTTFTDYYTVDTSRQNLILCKCNGDALPDIHVARCKAYMDKQHTVCRYLYREGRSGGSFGGTVEEGFFSLSGDTVTFDKIRGREFRFNVKHGKEERVSYYLFSDNKATDIDKAGWKKAREAALDGMESGKLYFQWIRIRKKDSEKKIRKKLLKSWTGFSVEMKAGSVEDELK